jgi:hypothetical protein
MIESGLERLVKIQIRTAIRQLITELRAVSLLAASKLTEKEVSDISRIIRDACIVADHADNLWNDTPTGEGEDDDSA